VRVHPVFQQHDSGDAGDDGGSDERVGAEEAQQSNPPSAIACMAVTLRTRMAARNSHLRFP